MRQNPLMTCEVFSYIANELLAPQIAEGQVRRIRQAIRSLSTFPERHTAVNWEPWASLGMRFFPVNNYVVYYLVNKEKPSVEIVRIFYGGRDTTHIIQDENY